MASLGRKPKKLCEAFEANEKAFGVCRKCGFSLAEHLAKDEEVEEDVELLEEDIPGPPEEPPSACKNFTWKLDRNGSGVCVCGFPKEEHKVEEVSSRNFSVRLTDVARRISKRFSMTRGKVVLSKPKGQPCSSFRINLEGEQYGLCKCGFGKREHDEAARMREEKAAKDELEREKARKAERGKPNEPCQNFTLDLQNKEGYGYCKCGFRRDQHMDFTTKANFAAVRSTLTAPKPFE